MPSFYLGWQTNRHPHPAEHLTELLAGVGSAPLTGAARLALPYLSLAFAPEALTLTCAAAPDVWHYFRWADATLRPMPPAPPPLVFARGDTYIALAPAAAHITDSAAIARFIHLRDYFNAAKLAAVLWAHLEELAEGRPLPAELDVLVVEVR